VFVTVYYCVRLFAYMCCVVLCCVVLCCVVLCCVVLYSFWSSNLAHWGGRYRRCMDKLKYHPVRWVYKCIVNDVDIINAIKKYEQHERQMILVCSDEMTKEVKYQLQWIFGNRLLFFDEFCMQNKLSAFECSIQCHALLQRTSFFVGTFFSSFSTTIVLMRNFQNYAYFGHMDSIVHTVNLGYLYFAMIVLSIIFIVAICMRLGCRKHLSVCVRVCNCCSSSKSKSNHMHGTVTGRFCKACTALLGRCRSDTIRFKTSSNREGLTAATFHGNVEKML